MSLTDRGERGGGATGPPASAEVRGLVLAHQAGDPTAFDDIVRRYYPALLSHARRRLHDAKAAEDAVQEAFLRAYRSLPGFDGDYQLGAWLHRIVANVCSTEGVRRRREADLNQRWAAMVSPQADLSVEEHGEHSEALARVIAAVERLSPAYREAFVLREVFELDYADVADRTGVSEDNARARVHRARLALRKTVGRTAGVGTIIGLPFRRIARLGARIGHHVNGTACLAPEAVSSTPSRIAAIGTIAGTGAAVVAVTGAPLWMAPATAPPSAVPPVVRLTTGRPLPASPPDTSVVTVPGARAGAWSAPSPGPTVSVTSTAVRPALGTGSSTSSSAPSTTSTTSTTTITSTTGRPSPSTSSHPTVAPVTVAPPVALAVPTITAPALAPGPPPLATILSDHIGIENGYFEWPAVLGEAGQADQTANLSTHVLVPSSGSPACQGRINGRLDWATSPSDALGDALSFTAAFVGSERLAAGTVYHFRGRATAQGTDMALGAHQGVIGTIYVPSGGTVGALDVQLVAPGLVSPPATCTPAGPWIDGAKGGL